MAPFFLGSDPVQDVDKQISHCLNSSQQSAPVLPSRPPFVIPLMIIFPSLIVRCGQTNGKPVCVSLLFPSCQRKMWDGSTQGHLGNHIPSMSPVEGLYHPSETAYISMTMCKSKQMWNLIVVLPVLSWNIQQWDIQMASFLFEKRIVPLPGTQACVSCFSFPLHLADLSNKLKFTQRFIFPVFHSVCVCDQWKYLCSSLCLPAIILLSCLIWVFTCQLARPNCN